MFTFLAITFVVLLVAAVFYGFGIIVRKPPTAEDLSSELCTLCRRKFPRESLVERQVGDSRLYYFCHDCIGKLREDSKQKSIAAG